MLDGMDTGSGPVATAHSVASAGPPKIGDYIIERELGRGGMGAVFVGVHETIGKRVAIKVLLPNATFGDEMQQRFINEARAASAIRHPGIVEVFAYGVDEGRAYIVMELLEGTSLAKRLERLGSLPIFKAVAIARQVALALDAAHSAGIVHRDLKPDNIFLRADSDNQAQGEKVVLLDFGIAKLAEFVAPGSAQTVTGTLLGTPQYMSPEQCEGARNVDLRSDLYSLGVTLFLMLTGRLPFEAEGMGGYIGAHLHVQPPSLKEHLPMASDALANIVARLLAKSPAARFQTASSLAKALASSEVFTEAPPPSPLPEVRTLPPLASSQRRFKLIGVAVAAGIVLLALAWFAGTRSRRSIDPAEHDIPVQTPAPTAPDILASAQRGDHAAVYAACQAQTQTLNRVTIGPCLVAACMQQDAAQARAWYRAFRASNRRSDAATGALNECVKLGVEKITLDEVPPPMRTRR